MPPTGPRRSRRTARRAGRNVPQSIAVGVALIAVLLASLYVERAAFVGLAAVAVLVAVWEIAGALRTRGVRVPVLPLGTGSVAMLVTAYTAGAGPLLGVLLVTCAAVLVWRAVDGPEGFVADATAGVFTAAYVPLLASFALLLLREHDGPDRIVAFILAVVGSDVGGFVTGVLWGRHPMVPRISPRKSWEGFAGSLVLGTGVGAAVVPWLLDGPAWGGALLGLAAVVTATAGDLAESLIKRDLGVKDMGSVLPGHGGVMDRLDSLLPTAPVAYLVLSHVLSR
ncbi:phosphatidate cytidylyltransferase [Motilibacter rhizosphaerae]|uniref:phosphatidate cytidylyltransferase n=1 Tax=Motilibacter rhizosphaerae TaxID=598652 RepID=UPI001E39F6EA|nr:phosphatidate cytidylyltransferase [Motilibacter rhizosphaerae]